MANIFKGIGIEAVQDILKIMRKNDTAVIKVTGKERDGERKYNVNLNLGIDDVSKLFGEGTVEIE